MPTALAYHGNCCVEISTHFRLFGLVKFYEVNPAGQVKLDVGGSQPFSALFSWERSNASSRPAPPPVITPFTGKVIRVDPSGKQTEIISGLFFPTGMTLARMARFMSQTSALVRHRLAWGDFENQCRRRRAGRQEAVGTDRKRAAINLARGVGGLAVCERW